MTRGRSIILVGMPGAGKSTVGKALAKALDADFLDTDDLMRAEMGMDLPEFIAANGGEAFRALEDRVLARLELDGQVVATGGSVVYGHAAMENLRQQGSIVYLKVAIPEILARVEREPRGIAMVSADTLEGELMARAGLYEAAADLTVECDGLDVEDVIGDIWGRL